jgi:hypothetical protein
MLEKIRRILFPLGLASFVLATLSWNLVPPSPLPIAASFVLSKDNEGEVYVEAKALNLEETRDYVNRDLLSRGYQPILLQIDNTSPFSYEIKKSQVDMQMANAKKIVQEIGRSSLPRTIAYKILGFFFWPFMIPGTIDSARAWNKEYTLQKELNAKTLKEEGEIIPAYSSMSRLLYIPKEEIKETFHLSLTNLDEHLVEDFFLLVENLPS